MRDCLDGLWADVGGIVITAFIDVGRPSLQVYALFLGLELWTVEKVQKS